MAIALRAERLDVRVTRTQKRTIEKAAHLRGTSLTDFVVNEIQAAAIATIKEFEGLELRNEDNRVFVDALLNPPKPSLALQQAVARHKELGL
ncbi:MAG TPA: DUF1778 domain-containing protein [Nitrospira sp.]|nr:DUF1778 domain-containing protein [Nitrospira sp.]